MISWSHLKVLIASKNIYPQYSEDANNYYIKLIDSNVLIDECIINKQINIQDKAEFEASYKSLSNGPLNGVKVIGNTDGTKIGNIGDRLKVDSTFSRDVSSAPSISNLRFDDMSVANGGVARDTSVSAAAYTTIYNISGSGLIFAMVVTFEGNLLGADPFLIKMTVDSITAFEVNTFDIGTSALYNLEFDTAANLLGMQIRGNSLMMKVPGNSGLAYNSSVKIELKKATGSTKRFRAGMITLTRN